MASVEYDVIVVGSGAGGSAAAWRLSKLGLRVACIERGDWQAPEKYPSTGLDWEVKKRKQFSYRPAVRNMDSDYVIDTRESDIDIANFNGVGGATVLFSGHFPRFHPSDFCTYTLDGVGADWPITYSDLEPYFNVNDRIMRVAGLVGDPAYPDMNGLLPPVPIGEYGEKIAEGFNRLGWHWWPSYAAIATTTASGSPCLNLGPCNTGCPQGAKSSTDVTYLPDAMRSGLDVITNSTVVNVEVSPSGKTQGVWVVDRMGDKRFISAKVVVIACNAVGTARLLLASKSAQHPDGLANSSGLVGKNLMLHPLGHAEGLFDHAIDLDKGPQGCCIYSHEFYETDEERDFKRGYTLHVLRGGGIVETTIAGMERREVRWGSTLITDMRAMHRRRGSIAVICEDLPDLRNRVRLDEHRIDRDGMPITVVEYRVGKNSTSMMHHGLTQAKRVLKASGLKKVMAFGPVREAGWHLLGTAKMGNDPTTSVVAKSGETHDVSGLFIADGSVFPTSGGVNPASTIQAVALYIADCIYSKHFGILTVENAIDRLY